VSKKYNKINKESVLNLFSREKQVINRNYIAKQLNCSVYSVRIALEELKDDNKIKLSNYGYIKNN